MLLSLQQCKVWHLYVASWFTIVYSWPLENNHKAINDQMINLLMNGLRLVVYISIRSLIIAVLFMYTHEHCSILKRNETAKTSRIKYLHLTHPKISHTHFGPYTFLSALYRPVHIYTRGCSILRGEYESMIATAGVRR